MNRGFEKAQRWATTQGVAISHMQAEINLWRKANPEAARAWDNRTAEEKAANDEAWARDRLAAGVDPLQFRPDLAEMVARIQSETDGATVTDQPSAAYQAMMDRIAAANAITCYECGARANADGECVGGEGQCSRYRPLEEPGPEEWAAYFSEKAISSKI